MSQQTSQQDDGGRPSVTGKFPPAPQAAPRTVPGQVVDEPRPTFTATAATADTTDTARPGSASGIDGEPADADDQSRPAAVPVQAAGPREDALRAATPDPGELDGPLLGDAAGLRANWERAQSGFVDDPPAAVADAAELIEHTAQALIGALRQRQRQLRTAWDRGAADGTAGRASDLGESGSAAAGGVPDTEELRLIMRRYRALFNQICRP